MASFLVWVERKRSTRQLEVVDRPVTHGDPRRSLKVVRVARVLAPEVCNSTPDAERGCQSNDIDDLKGSPGT